MATFALSPAEAVSGVIDYTSAEGRKLYTTAIAKLDEVGYDCQPEGLYAFLKSLARRAQEFGWTSEYETGILHIPRDDGSGYDNLLNHYGEISLETIRTYEKAYIGRQSRAAQDTNLLFKCLMNTLTKEGKDKILVWEEEYTVETKPSGTLFLKVIVRESHLDTNATTSQIRTKLSSLDIYIQTIGSDIVKFNGYVKLLIDSLAARGQRTEDLLTNLFKGYLAASDKVFVEYIDKKKDDYEDGTSQYDSDSLMQVAANKFKNLKDQGKWNAPSDAEEKILALEAQIKSLKRNTSRNKATNQEAKKGGAPVNKKPAWMSEKPSKADLAKPKKWNGRKWYYCSTETGGKCDGKWRCHEPTKCQGKEFKYPDKDNKRSQDKGEKKDNSQKKLKLSKALSSIIESQDKDDDDEDTE